MQTLSASQQSLPNGGGLLCCADSTCIVLSIFAGKCPLMLQAHTSYLGTLLGAGHDLQIDSGTAIFVPALRRTFTLSSAEAVDKALRGLIRTVALGHHVQTRAPVVQKNQLSPQSLHFG